MMHDIVAVLFLVVLEGLLSFDNALALAAMVRHLPEKEQKRALAYGMAGAFLFRFIALGCVVWLSQALWIKFLGGAYLVWLSLSHLLSSRSQSVDTSRTEVSSTMQRGFWMTVLMVELTDVVFSVDSILAAVAVSDKLWVIVTGGIMGIIMMRVAASFFVGLINRFPLLERSAFLIVGIVGVKLILHYFGIHGDMVKTTAWILMLVALVSGFMPKKVGEAELG